jgi:hypothetical protein
MTAQSHGQVKSRAYGVIAVQRIGYLGFGPTSAWATRVEALRAGLRDLGWVEGKNIVIEFRWADKVDELPALAAALVRLPVDVIFANSATQVEAAQQARQTTPSSSRTMPTRSASDMWRASRGPAATSQGFRCYSLKITAVSLALSFGSNSITSPLVHFFLGQNAYLAYQPGPQPGGFSSTPGNSAITSIASLLSAIIACPY